MNIAAILHDQAVRYGQRPAILQRRRVITFEELDRAASAAAEDLEAAGLRPGMRALVFVPLSIELYVTMIGLFRLRATAVFVDPSAGRDRLDACISRVRPDAFLAIPRAHLLRFSSPVVRALSLKVIVGARVPFLPAVGVRLAREAAPVVPCDSGTPAIVTFTSGSTGEPRAAVRTHGFLVAQHQALVESLGLSAGDIDLTTLPIFLLANLASGVTSVIPDADLRAPGSISPAPVLAQVLATGATRTVASPALLLRLAGHPAGSRNLGTLRRIFTGGAPVFPAALDTITRSAPAATVVAVYGSTEAEPIAQIAHHAISNEDRLLMRGGAGLLAGVPARSLSLRILPDRWSIPLGPWTHADLEREALPAGSIGEIVVSGEHVLPGYLDGRGDEETKIRVGGSVWHRTGDAGYLDVDGRLWLLGRCSARVQDGHGTLYPFAVECAASDSEAVHRTAFVQHDDKRVLVVELSAGADAERAMTDLRQRLGWARLDRVLVVPRIPVDLRHNAKIDYPALRQMLNARPRS